MKQYLDLLRYIMENGNDRGSRAGGTRSVFGYQMRMNLQEGFPLLTTKKMHTKAIVHELIWFLKGDTNIKYLLENDIHIWSADAYRVYKKFHVDNGLDDGWALTLEQFERKILEDEEFGKKFGDLGPVYGSQWRQWQGREFIVDQIKEVINSIKLNPEGRRHIVTAWNPAEVDKMALPPCHCLFQFYVHDNKLSCHMYQRSADTFLGVPFNIASYALLTHIIAHQTGLGVGDLIISFGDIHIYNQHRDAVDEQLHRVPLPLLQLSIFNRNQGMDEYELSDFHLDDYQCYGPIKAELSVGV